MAKQVNARIAQKIDSLENWKKATGFVPLEGEFFLVNDRDCPVSIGDGKTSANILCDKALFDKVDPDKITSLVSGKFTVSGVWYFNETIPKNEVRFEGITFTSGGGNFDTIYVANEKPWALLYSDYSMGKDSITAYDIEADSWDEPYRTVDFGTTAQEVSEEFYTWLTANAVKQQATEVSGKWYFNEVLNKEYDTSL